MRGWPVIAHYFDLGIVAELPSLLRYARALTRDDAAAEDLVQDAMVLACQRRETYQEGRSLRTWLCAIIHNRFVDDQRRLRAERNRDHWVAREAGGHVDATQEDAIRLNALERAFLGLPRNQRTVLHLVAVEGLSYREVATALAVPLGTVMSRLSRARAALRQAEALPGAVLCDTARRLRVVGGQDERIA